MNNENNVIYLSDCRASLPAAASAEAPASPQPKPVVRRPRHSRSSAGEDLRDDEIVERVALGDVEAAEVLRERYSGQLCRAATLILGDEREVARVVEAALEEACCGWPPERGHVGRWLVRLVRRAAVSRKRMLWGLDGSQSQAARRRRYQYPKRSKTSDSVRH